MLQRLFVAFVLSSVFSLCSHSDYNYLSYYKKINEAEICINDENYNKALKIYQKLFKDFPNYPYKDVHNACLCATKTGQSTVAFKYARELILHGYEWNDFDTLSFKTLKNTPNKWGSLMNSYPVLRKQYLKGLDTLKRKAFFKLFQADQRAASNDSIWLQDSIFHLLSNKLFNSIKENGFPRYFLNKDTLSFNLLTMLRHYCGLENRLKNSSMLSNDPLYKSMITHDIKPLTKKMLINGFITPQVYEGVISYWDKNPYGEITIRIDFDEEKVFPEMNKTPEELIKINELRDSIGLFQVGELSFKMLNSTWYSQYPFREIKTAIESCDSCYNRIDYVIMMTKIEDSVRNKYNETHQKNEGFILPDMEQIKNVYITYKFLSSKKRQIKNDSNN